MTASTGALHSLGEALDPLIVDDGRRPGLGNRPAQKGTFSRIALDKMHRGSGQIGEEACYDDARQSGTGAEVDPCLRRGQEGDELRAVGDVPFPDEGQGRAGDQVLCRLPFAQERNIGLQPIDRFT